METDASSWRSARMMKMGVTLTIFELATIKLDRGKDLKGCDGVEKQPCLARIGHSSTCIAVLLPGWRQTSKCILSSLLGPFSLPFIYLHCGNRFPLEGSCSR